MPREVLVHLNCAVPDGDARSAEEIAQAIVDTLALDPEVIDLDISAPLAEEV